MVIECIGLPGSGKTELIGQVEKELKRREIDYINVAAKLRRNVFWKLLRVLAGVLIYLSADARWLRGRLEGILEKEGEHQSGFGLCENEKKTFRAAAVYASWYRRMIRSHKLFLFDEGMVQALTVFCADHRISGEAFQKMVLASEKGIRSSRLVILNETTVEEALSALESGTQDRDIADKVEGDKRAGLLGEWERLNEVYKKNFHVLEIQSTDEKRRKLSRVFGRIRQILSSVER